MPLRELQPKLGGSLVIVLGRVDVAEQDPLGALVGSLLHRLLQEAAGLRVLSRGQPMLRGHDPGLGRLRLRGSRCDPFELAENGERALPFGASHVGARQTGEGDRAALLLRPHPFAQTDDLGPGLHLDQVFQQRLSDPQHQIGILDRPGRQTRMDLVRLRGLPHGPDEVTESEVGEDVVRLLPRDLAERLQRLHPLPADQRIDGLQIGLRGVPGSFLPAPAQQPRQPRDGEHQHQNQNQEPELSGGHRVSPAVTGLR
ncbi:MAG: hypothetical protein KC729_18920 [Candidatus Eisenbacteria bacterium]|uniref:Uncharacterized protein n=1 Tax=Eiseniibacteriota bacterium TaxID=2212470 RepID=A0A956RQY3_UNCEI|nr:hypothetical protein [Candidatus Eisenbacteria bacterium]